MADIDIDREDLKEQLKLTQPFIRDNVQIVGKSAMNDGRVYHIARHRQSKMFPFISKRQKPDEDNTLPRIHVCSSLIGCFRSYGDFDSVGTTEVPVTKDTEVDDPDHPTYSNYKGGYYIHELNPVVGLLPNKKLTGNETQDELWLIAYNELTKTYPAKGIGRIILKEVTFRPKAGSMPDVVNVFALEVTGENGLKLADRRYLTRGCYLIKTHNHTVESCTSIAKADFDAVREYSASMLSHRDSLPPFLRW